MNAIESVLEKTMREVGYTRFAKYIYRGLFSTEEVEHFVYFRRYGIRKRYLSGVFAARNRKADEFAIVEINKYGGELYRLMEYDTRYSCLMKFPLGVLAGGQPRSSIDLEEWSPDELSSKLKNDVLSKLPPRCAPGYLASRLDISLDEGFGSIQLGLWECCHAAGPDYLSV